MRKKFVDPLHCGVIQLRIPTLNAFKNGQGFENHNRVIPEFEGKICGLGFQSSSANAAGQRYEVSPSFIMKKRVAGMKDVKVNEVEQQDKERKLIALVNEFRDAKEPGDVFRLGDQLGRMIFGDGEMGPIPS